MAGKQQRESNQGAISSFQGFYESERAPLIRAVTMITGDLDHAADAVDEAMTRAYAQWCRIENYASPAGWVYRVAHNHAISAWRKRRRERPGVLPETGREDPPLPDRVMAEAVRGLPEAYREVIVLRYYLDWTQPEIAEAIGVPVGTVKSRIGRGLGQLRDELAVVAS